MYNQYNPYMNRFYGQQQANIPQSMEMPIQQQNTPQMTLNRQNSLCGKVVESIDVVKAIDINLDGSINYFPVIDGSAIVTKQIKSDGTSKTIIYKPVDDDSPKYATVDDVDKKIKTIDLSSIDDLRDDVDDIKKELKEIKSKLKNKKED